MVKLPYWMLNGNKLVIETYWEPQGESIPKDMISLIVPNKGLVCTYH